MAKKNIPYEDNPISIKYHVKQYFIRNKERIKNKTVVDLPAGNGVTSKIIKDMGGIPLAYDLFPEYFNIDGIECKRANIMDKIPMEQGSADFAICQEGIEHFTDQFKAFREFNRILKMNGSLIMTTPNYSSLRSRLSYFLQECERFNSIMPPNEIDSVWMNNQDVSGEIYFGHVFLIGIQKLRVMASLAGFKIKHIQFTRLRTTSLALFIINYPFIWLSSTMNYYKNKKKDKGVDSQYQQEVYKEVYKLSISPKILLDGHLFVEFEKIQEASDVAQNMKSVHRSFSEAT